MNWFGIVGELLDDIRLAMDWAVESYDADIACAVIKPASEDAQVPHPQSDRGDGGPVTAPSDGGIDRVGVVQGGQRERLEGKDERPRKAIPAQRCRHRVHVGVGGLEVPGGIAKARQAIGVGSRSQRAGP